MAPPYFALVQAGPGATGTGSVACTTSAAVTTGNFLIAGLFTPSTAAGFTAPNNNWRLAKTMAAPANAGHLEIWYLEPKYNTTSGLTSFTFSGPGGVNCRGQVSEFSLASGYHVVLESAGQNNGNSAGSFPISSACGNVADVLGYAALYAIFSGSEAGGSWTPPSGYTTLRSNINSANNWHTCYNADVASGNQSITDSHTFTSGTFTGWCGGFVTFRAIRFDRMATDGVEQTNTFAISPDGQVGILGGDVECSWRSVDPVIGDHWQLIMQGQYGGAWHVTAGLAFSQLEANTVYRLTGDDGTSDGGFQASTDNGTTWTMRSTSVQFRGNGTTQPPRVVGAQDSDRSVGNHLIAQDTTNNLPNGHLYCAEFLGVKRSNTLGNAWTDITPSSPGRGNVSTGAGMFPRAVVCNPNNPKEIWVACWASSNGGGVYHTSDATVATPTWNRLGGYMGTVGDLVIVGSYLYAGCQLNGVWRAPLGGGALTNLSGDKTTGNIPVDGTAKCNGIDGYVAGSGAHIIMVAISDGSKPTSSSVFQGIVKMSIPSSYPGSGSITYTDLTNAGTVQLAKMPPVYGGVYERDWWRASAPWHYWLGGSGYTNAHVVIDPSNTQRIYLTGAGGFFRSTDGGTNWTMATNGMPMLAYHNVLIDPLNSNHIIMAGSDLGHTDTTDPTGYNAAAVTVSNPGPASTESHGIAFDGDTGAAESVYMGINDKYGASTGGQVYQRNSTSPSGWGSEIGYAAASGGVAPNGMYAGTDAAGKKFVLVVGQGKGLYRGSHASGSWVWTNPSSANGTTAIGTNGQVSQINEFAAKSSSASTIYLFDRKSGIFRSTDYGVTWTKIWAKTVQSQSEGFLAINPNVSGEIWASTSDTNGLYRLTNANNGTVAGGQITLTQITSGASRPVDPGGLAFFQGSLYVVWQNTSTHTSVQIVSTANPSDPTPTWADAGIPELSSYVQSPTSFRITSNGQAILATGFNNAMTGSVVAAAAPALSIPTTSLPGATQSSVYSAGVSATGGTPPYTFTLNSGSLPAGLTLNSDGSITGTPTGTGTSTFTVKVTDNVAATATSGSLSITVTAAGVSLSVTTTSLPDGAISASYSQTLAATGGTSPYTWSIVSGLFPPGLSMTAGGVISGTISAVGTYSFTVQVADSASHTAQQALSINVPGGTITVNTGTIPNAAVDSPYFAQLSASGGTPPYTWAVIDTGGGGDPATFQLPTGFTLDANGGFISGTTYAAGLRTITVQVTDSVGNAANAMLLLRVVLGFTTVPDLPAGHVVTADELNTLGAAASFILKKPVARVHDGTGGAAIGTSPTIIHFDTEDFDPDGMYQTGVTERLTIQTSGWYKIRYGVNVTGGHTTICWAKATTGPGNPQGAGVSSGNQWASYNVSTASGAGAGTSGVWPFYLYAGDFIQIFAQADSTGNTTDVSVAGSYLGLEFVSV